MERNVRVYAVLGAFTKHNPDGILKLKHSLRCALGENTKRGGERQKQ